MDNKQRTDKTNPILKANLFSKFFFCWISPLLSLGYRKPLEINDLSNPVPIEQSKFLTDQLEIEWNKELAKAKQNKKPSLIRAIVRLYFWKVFFNGVLLVIEEMTSVLQPILTSELLKYFNGEIDFNLAFIYGTCICLNVFVIWFVHHPYSINCSRFGMRLRIACCGLVYRKSLKLTTNKLDSKTAGRMLNLLSNDAARLDTFLLYLPYFIITPLQVGFIIYFLIKMVDISFLAGFIIFLIFMPIQAVMAKIYNCFRTKASYKTDERIDLVTEILNGIKIIKMYCWEEPFRKLVKNLRSQEIRCQAYLHSISAVNSLFENDLSCFITYLSVTIFVCIMKIPFAPSYLVYAMGYYGKLCTTLGYYLSRAITQSMSTLVSLKRFEEFLLYSEFQNDKVNDEVNNASINVSKMSASWTTDFDGFYLNEISFRAEESQLIAVVGSVGSGKSSLLMALMKEIETIKGVVDINGSIFYVSQEPWIFNSTIKQNILFGKSYDKNKFEEVLKACSLDKDLMLFPDGENTMIGEKGINLSGGQRSRVSLARALYYDAQIYLIDDPLSAVDTNVAKHIFEKCINGYLKSKIRVLVTHQVHHLENADHIIVLDDGDVLAQGTYKELNDKGLNLSSYLDTSSPINIEKKRSSKKKTEAFEKKIPKVINSINSESLNNLKELEKLIPTTQTNTSEEGIKKQLKQMDYDEKQNFGKIGWGVYTDYFKSGGGVFGGVLVMFLFVATKVLIMCADYYVSEWATDEENRTILAKAKLKNMTSPFMNSNSTNNFIKIDTNEFIFDDEFAQSRFYHFKIYSYLVGFFLILIVIRSIMFFFMCVRSSQKFHKTMLDSVMSASMRFFDLNPLGRIMNRFSTDIGVVDDIIPITMFDFLHITMIVIGSFGIAIFINYWVLIPIVPLLVAFFYVRNYFLASSRELKRIEGIYRSPIFVHANSTLSGISTIRASNKMKIFNKEFETHLDYHTRAYFAFICTQRWFSLRLDLIVCFFLMFAVYSSILAKESLQLKSGQIGLLLVYLFQLSNLFYWAINTSCEIENWMTSIERIKDYTKIKTEPFNESGTEPPKDWPNSGSIEFEDVSFTYDTNLPYVLKNLSIKIKPGEKIGVVGRTGAGKSSLFQTLFRLGEHTGRVSIDGIDIKSLSLHNLRKKISIIPQEPTLFIGTVRSNLDPFGEKTDSELWNSLDYVQLKETILEMKGGLDAEIQKGGSNLSVGQKQLICLARAILKKSKILIIDEATANCDFKTDELVQKAIRECFHDCTVLTIAHRLQTIMDSDRILCLRDGELENFQSPQNLLKDKTCLFFELVSFLGKDEKEILPAKKSEDEKKIS